MAYLGLLTDETEYHFEDIYRAIWQYNWRHRVVELIMPVKVFAQLCYKAKQESLGAPFWNPYGDGRMAILGIPIKLDERIEGIEYLIEEKSK